MKILIGITFSILLILTSCAVVYYPADVNFLGEKQNETIILQSYGYSKVNYELITLKGTSKAIADAETKAFKALLFNGVPGSQYTRPLIENEAKARETNKAFFREFFEGGYKRYILSSVTKNQTRVRGNRRFTQEINIDVRALRVGLEQASIIRKFGF